MLHCGMSNCQETLLAGLWSVRFWPIPAAGLLEC